MESLKLSSSLLFEHEFGWQKHAAGNTAVWFRGHVHGRSTAELGEAFQTAVAGGSNQISALIGGLDGHFSIVIEDPGWTLAAVDPVRSQPLVWGLGADGGLVLDYDGQRLARRLGLGLSDIDTEMAATFALSGFTIGDTTISKGIRQIGPGEFLFSKHQGQPQIHRYHQWKPWEPCDADYSDLSQQLSTVNWQLIEDLAASAAGRPIVIPLSAGLDSRFIASGLAQAGYPDVRTFSYGLKGNREADIARDIARRLGLPWTFVPYTNRDLAGMFRSDGYRAFMEYSDSLTSIHFPQEYFALNELRQRGLLPDDAIMVNGQSGDFIAGNHIPKSLQTPDMEVSKTTRRDRVVTALIEKHYKHWQCLITADRLAIIRRLLERQIEDIGGMPDDPRGDHGIYEYCEFQDRQSKYVINGQRLYEFFGLDWRLPLWERRYLDFWEKVPVELKAGERLYRDVLIEDNWGGVWRDIPVNPTRIRPAWIRPVRFASKVLCAPFGRQAWHRVEKRFLGYFTATTCAYAAFPYSRVARDNRGHTSAISWHTEAYLSKKGLTFDGERKTA